MQILKVITGAIAAFVILDILVLAAAFVEISDGKEVSVSPFWRWQMEQVVSIWQKTPHVSTASAEEQ